MEPAWLIEPDATSFFAIAENGWRAGAQSRTSPVSLEIPERIGTGVEISARSASAANIESAYDLSPLTRWTIGESGGLGADSDVPPAPVFGLQVAPSAPGALELAAPGFAKLVNTTSITAGTYAFHYYDEINGAGPVARTTALNPGDTSNLLPVSYSVGTLLQIEREIVQVQGSNSDGSTILARGVHTTSAAGHAAGTLIYKLADKIAIVPFVKNFFGTPSSGDWRYSSGLPNVRLASAELSMTNALGNGPAAVNEYTGTIDSGLRTLAGGQYSFQITGFLAIQTGAAPNIIVDADRSVRDMYAVLRLAPAGSAGLRCSSTGTASGTQR